MIWVVFIICRNGIWFSITDRVQIVIKRFAMTRFSNAVVFMVLIKFGGGTFSLICWLSARHWVLRSNCQKRHWIYNVRGRLEHVLRMPTGRPVRCELLSKALLILGCIHVIGQLYDTKVWWPWSVDWVVYIQLDYWVEIHENCASNSLGHYVTWVNDLVNGALAFEISSLLQLFSLLPGGYSFSIPRFPFLFWVDWTLRWQTRAQLCKVSGCKSWTNTLWFYKY